MFLWISVSSEFKDASILEGNGKDIPCDQSSELTTVDINVWVLDGIKCCQGRGIT